LVVARCITAGEATAGHSSSDEFRGSVSMYMGWKQGMDVCVSHVRRRQIPAYVFPNCVRPARPPRPAGLTG